MATIPRPYTKQVQVYNPQRSAAVGTKQNLLEELSPAMRYKAGATPVSEMLYSTPSPVEQPPMVDYFGGGPGTEGVVPGISGVEAGVISKGVADLIEGIPATIAGFEKGEHGYVPSTSFPFGVPSFLSDPVMSGLIKGGKIANEALGDPLGKGKDAIANALANSFPDLANMIGLGGYGNTQGTGMQGGIAAAQAASQAHGLSEAADANLGAPPSPLGDIGIGAMGSEGFGPGGFGLGGFGTY